MELIIKSHINCDLIKPNEKIIVRMIYNNTELNIVCFMKYKYYKIFIIIFHIYTLDLLISYLQHENKMFSNCKI